MIERQETVIAPETGADYAVEFAPVPGRTRPANERCERLVRAVGESK